MLVFIDESGDPGLRLTDAASRYFVVALVTFQDNQEALACDQSIAHLRQELGLAATYEFHFSHNSRRVKEAFLQRVTPAPFSYHVFALNKADHLISTLGLGQKTDLYHQAARLALENAKPYLRNLTVVLDRRGDAAFRNELAVYLRRALEDPEGPKLFKKIKIQRSESNNLLQLADYVAGVSHRVLQGKEDGVALRQRFLAAHEQTNVVWPKR